MEPAALCLGEEQLLGCKVTRLQHRGVDEVQSMGGALPLPGTTVSTPGKLFFSLLELLRVSLAAAWLCPLRAGHPFLSAPQLGAGTSLHRTSIR